MTTTTFEYGLARIGELDVQTQTDETKKRSVVTGIGVGGDVAKPTTRFWTSLFMRFGVSETIFKYFDHAEVFERISERSKNDLVRYCVEVSGKKRTLLAVSNPDRPVVSHDEVCELTSRYGAMETSYSRGVVTTTHTPRSGNQTFELRGDRFQHRFVMDTPIDGFTQPKIHLSFLRLLCSNGAVGYSRAFRSELAVGKDPTYSLVRAMESFDNDEGYSALRQRFAASQTSWASIHETEMLYRTLARLGTTQEIRNASDVLARYRTTTGDLRHFYGLANLDALSIKRQRVLPARCKVYDLVNFASEVATHHAAPGAARSLQAYIGGLISDEYDLEGTAEKVGEFKDFFMDAGPGAPPQSVN
ncbi:MAG TPA: DUF932 domain-containing protein [Pirellulales bacterium]